MSNDSEYQNDLRILTKLNADYLRSDQTGDVACYESFLADDFTASLPDFQLHDRKRFLEGIAEPRPFTDLQADDVVIRILGDFAIIHAHTTFRTLDGVKRQGRYTDDYQRRNGKWVCVAANVIAEGL